MSYLDKVVEAIEAAESSGRVSTLDGVTGLSGDKLIGALQRCAAIDPASAYVEVGVFQGLTLTSVAAAAPATTCAGIDNFSQFDPGGINKSIVQQRIANHAISNARLINADFEEALLTLKTHLPGQRVGTYFVDGPHDYRSQYVSLDFARHALAESCVVFVDDANYEHVRRANSDWLRANPEFALVFEAYTSKHPEAMEERERSAAMSGWWNGVNIMVRDPEFRLERRFPAVSQSRDLYLNEHVVHPSRYASLAPRLVGALDSPLPWAALRLMKALVTGRRSHDRPGNLPGGPGLPVRHLVPFKESGGQ